MASIPEVRILKPVLHGDDRGFFSETFSKRSLEAAGIFAEFVQDNHSRSTERGVVRGLHFQTPPFAQAKLLRVTKGSIFDVAVDIRRGSPTYGQWIAEVISADAWNQIFIPVGFAHGFCTLEPGSEVLYKVSNYYAPECDRGLAWNDPALAIPWPVAPDEAILSSRDCRHPTLAELPAIFTYEPPAYRAIA
ncbi:MAG TPA: dTDP-4-dehydrorhamnose 3,5-epimerase [Stellaceae bacterium]|nr:dTDP-4-dehydrorhamnose 3,5-epimerase [Stellaceae bacterium]